MKMLIDLTEKVEKTSDSIKVHSGPGRGKKQCPECKVYVGVRTRKCICGAEFKRSKAPVKVSLTKAPVEKKEKKTIVKTDKPYSRVLLTPKGKCPVKFDKEYSEESVREWAKKVRDHYLAKKTYLATEGILYFLRQFVSILSDEYKEIKTMIIAWDEESNGVR